MRNVGYAQGVIWRGGACTPLEYRPESGGLANTVFQDVNDAGTVVGFWYTRGTYFAVIYEKGKFKPSYAINSGGWTDAWGINNSGAVVGLVEDANRASYSYVLSNGRFTQFAFPGMTWSNALAINDSGQIVGEIQDGQGKVHGFYGRAPAAGPAPSILTVDDDGAECPGALTTIQEAVNRATAGTTIRVCPGNYWGTVTIRGPEKSGLKLIATGGEDDVVLRGDYTERNGFVLEDVDNVLIRGFTVRDFGDKPVTATEWGAGSLVYLHNAHYNRIEQNRLVNGDLAGIQLVDSGNNLIQNNVRWNWSAFAGAGIHLQGARSAGNTIRSNTLYSNKLAGIVMREAGPNNRINDNTILSNGRYGIQVETTSDVWIEGNRVSYGRGFWGAAMPGGQVPGVGIQLVNVTKATVFDNRARSNSGTDLSWDGNGENKIDSNACESSNPAGACGK
jgi:parallel beta-helix repeat protein